MLQVRLDNRFTLARPLTLAPVFIVWMLYFIHQKKYRTTAVISFLYFYWHTATFIFPFFLAFGYFIFEQFYGKKPDWKKIAWPLIGTLASVFLVYLISPGVVAYLKNVIFPVFFDTTLTKNINILEGNEVYGRNFFTVFSSFFWFLATLFIAGAYEILRYVQTKRGLQREDNLDLSPAAASGIASMVFLVASLDSNSLIISYIFFLYIIA
jgi:hypothetical protein